MVLLWLGGQSGAGTVRANLVTFFGFTALASGLSYWAGGLLVGASRAITDFSYCTYLSDLAVDGQFQRQGIGRELIHRTHEAAGFKTTLILLSAPAARSYYPHIGMQPHDSCWVIARR